MRVLVIGGTKFLGPYVVRILMARGHEVTVFHRGETESRLLPAVHHIHDSRAAIPVTEFPRAVLDLTPDVVIHMIAMGEADARAAIKTFLARAGRIVWLSSGDVYRAYGRLTGIEPGPVEVGLLTEESPLRSVLYPYRKSAACTTDLNYFYEKILVEKVALENRDAPSVVLRLPKMYGPGGNQDLATIYRHRHQGAWRWTHGYVENVAAAIVLAATHPAAVRRIYNVGESYTPTMAERLRSLPPWDLAPDFNRDFCFLHDIACDTTRIRSELGYREPVSYQEGIRRTLARGEE